ncbi:uncharacterized protein A4U43_C02F11540 [Asparagus officinalis]|uniref:Uncharacterized protein n=1 Tax=Asparagus officinalis TaxID=4686 RepID=A0A5P1FML6_ASPOF|nr:TPD1 protein homolog 1-like [Asparagus officinalis]ONK77860.1 uncharacterized protein A4U43_C02F11540 [Asparagus officinalis]
MAAFLKLFSALTVLSIILNKGWAAPCSKSDITVQQVKTGGIIEGKPEYKVLVSNNGKCIQSKVIMRCYGLSSVETVDPRAIRPLDEERCIVHSGRPLGRGASIAFKYAWMTPQDFPVISSQIHN